MGPASARRCWRAANVPDDWGDDLALGLPLALLVTRKALLKRFRPVRLKYDFTEVQWRVLRILAWQPGIGWTVSAICNRGCFPFAAPVVNDALFYLHERDLIRKYGRGHKPAAWRKRRLAYQPPKRWKAGISRGGLDIIAMVERRAAQERADLFQRLSAGEMALLKRLLQRLTASLLWRDGAPAEAQDSHPFAAQYDHFAAVTLAGARQHAECLKLMRKHGIARPPPRKMTRWWS